MQEEEMFGQSGGNTKYVSIVQGKFAQRVDEQTARDESGNLKPGYRKRELTKGTNAGKEVYEFTFDYLTGKLTNIRVDATDFGKQLLATFENGDTRVVVTMNLKNDNGTLTRPVSSFGDQIALVDLKAEVKFGLYKKDGSVKGVFFEQNGVFIPSPNENEEFKKHIADRPEPTQEKDLDGDLKWNWKQTSIWQYNQIEAAIDKFAAMGVGEDESVKPPTIKEEDEDDLPF